MPLRALEPESSASASSATTAPLLASRRWMDVHIGIPTLDPIELYTSALDGDVHQMRGNRVLCYTLCEGAVREWNY
jgi:hypothetical protein